MDNIFENRLFYDFYRELLTKHQQEILDLYYDEDLSLAEIAERIGSSRQAVYDLVKRTNKTLKAYEKKLHLVDNQISQERLINQLIDNLNNVLTKEVMSSDSKELLLKSIQELEKNHDF